MIFIGMDNGRSGHDYVLVDGEGKFLRKGRIPNESWAYEAWCDHIETTYKPERVVVGIEEGGGMSSPFDTVMQNRGWSVRQLSPEAVRAYREDFLRIHNKTDQTDAYTMAVMLVKDVACSAELNQERAALRRATRWRETLVKQRTALFNELRAALALYWPETTTNSVFKELDYVWVLDLLREYPDPVEIARLGVKRVMQFLRKRKSTVLQPTIEALVDVARKNRCFADDKPFLVKQTRQMCAILRELGSCKNDTEDAIADLTKDDADVQTVDAIYGISLVQAATFMAEVRSLQRFEDESNLASYAGQALKRVQTGKTKDIQRPQWRANRRLKRCVLGMAETLSMNDPASKAYYLKKTGEGKTHRQALRALGRHLIRRLFRLLQAVHHRHLREATPAVDPIG